MAPRAPRAAPPRSASWLALGLGLAGVGRLPAGRLLRAAVTLATCSRGLSSNFVSQFPRCRSAPASRRAAARPSTRPAACRPPRAGLERIVLGLRRDQRLVDLLQHHGRLVGSPSSSFLQSPQQTSIRRLQPTTGIRFSCRFLVAQRALRQRVGRRLRRDDLVVEHLVPLAAWSSKGLTAALVAHATRRPWRTKVERRVPRSQIFPQATQEFIG